MAYLRPSPSSTSAWKKKRETSVWRSACVRRFSLRLRLPVRPRARGNSSRRPPPTSTPPRPSEDRRLLEDRHAAPSVRPFQGALPVDAHRRSGERPSAGSSARNPAAAALALLLPNSYYPRVIFLTGKEGYSEPEHSS